MGLRRGAIWWAELPSPWGIRPVLLIARDGAYSVLSRFAVAPITTRVRQIPTTVVLDPSFDPVPDRCVVSLDHIHVVEFDWLIEPVGHLSAERMTEIDLALHRSLGIVACPADA